MSTDAEHFEETFLLVSGTSIRFSIFEVPLALGQRVATIDNRVTSGLVRASIRSEVEIQAFDLSDMTLSTERRHSVSLALHFWGSAHLCIEEAGRDNVDPREVPPFSSERSAEMPDGGLCCIVDLSMSAACPWSEGLRAYWLINRHIDDVC